MLGIVNGAGLRKGYKYAGGGKDSARIVYHTLILSIYNAETSYILHYTAALSERSVAANATLLCVGFCSAGISRAVPGISKTEATKPNT